jgi:hypothetical protein
MTAPDPTGPPTPTGPQEGRCGAVKAKNAKGEPIRWCRKYPRKGQTRCEDDGGSSPQALAAAERRMQEEAAMAYVARYGVKQHIEWHEAIQEGLDEAYGNVLALRDLVQRLAPEALTWGETEVRTVSASQFPGIDVTQAAGIVPVVELYGRERDRLHRMAVDAGKLGLEARRLGLAEKEQASVAEFFLATLAALDSLLQTGQLTSLSPNDPIVLRVLSEQLPALGASA